MRRAPLLVLALVLLPLAPACGTSEEAAAPSELRGRVVEVREERGSVTAFSVEADEERYELAIDPEIEYGFDLGHLHEHEETGDPVLCRVEERDGVLYALEIHDA